MDFRTVQVMDIWLHQHSYGRGGAVRIASKDGKVRHSFEEYDPARQQWDGVTLCPGTKQEATWPQEGGCGDLRGGDQLLIMCQYDTRGARKWIGYGMATGEMCSGWIVFEPNGPIVYPEHAWDKTRIEAGAATTGMEDTTLQSLQHVSQSLGLRPKQTVGDYSGDVLGRIYQHGVELFQSGQANLRSMGKLAKGGDGQVGRWTPHLSHRPRRPQAPRPGSHGSQGGVAADGSESGAEPELQSPRLTAVSPSSRGGLSAGDVWSAVLGGVALCGIFGAYKTYYGHFGRDADVEMDGQMSTTIQHEGGL